MQELPWSWMCAFCDTSNWCTSMVCFNCKKPKASPQENNNTVTSASIKDPRTLAQSSTGNISNEGDWICLSCNIINPPKRLDCYYCKTDKPCEKFDKSDSTEPGWTCRSCSCYNYDHQEHCHDCTGQRETVDPNYKQLPSDIGANDWVCSSCNCNNFEKRVTCFDCYRPRFDVDETFKYVQAPTVKGPKGMDWICPRCQYQNFAKRTECFKCSAPKHVEGAELAAQAGNSDWICTQCQTENIALRTFCNQCDRLRSDISMVRHIRKFRRRDKKTGRGGKSKNASRGWNPRIFWDCPSCNTVNGGVKKFCYNCSASKPGTDVDKRWSCKSCHQINPKTISQCSNCQIVRTDSNYKLTMTGTAITGNCLARCNCSDIESNSNICIKCKNQNVKQPYAYLEIENRPKFWDCERCNTRNLPYCGTCVKCLDVNPCPTEVSSSVQEISKKGRDAWKCGSCNSHSCNDRCKTFGKIKTDVDIPNIVEEGWKCLECDVLNLTMTNECRICNKLRSEVQGEEGELPDFDHIGPQKNQGFFAQLLPSHNR